MTQRTQKIRQICSDEDASFLMPGQGGQPTVVLFCGAQAPVVDKARGISTRAGLPDQWSLAVVDPDEAVETARWFGVSDQPAMGVVFDGALLAVEYECSTEAFERLLHVARQQFLSI